MFKLLKFYYVISDIFLFIYRFFDFQLMIENKQ